MEADNNNTQKIQLNAGSETIVLLDGHTTNPGDVSWDPIEKLGDVEIFPSTTNSDFASRVKDATIIISNKIVWDKKHLDLAPKLKMIALLSTGYNLVDFDEANKRGIVVCNVPAYSTPDVAQHTIALLLETTNHIWEYSESVRLGNWITSKEFTYQLDPLMEIKDKTLGIVGMGSIGQTVARVAQAFEMNIVFENPSQKPELENEHCKQVTLDELLTQSDIVSLHCPLTEDNKGMVNASFLSKMKKGSRLINTARGGLVVSQDVADALISGQLGYYAADVAEYEPMRFDDPLRQAPNTTITPHIAWATAEARQRLICIVAQNIEGYLSGHPQNVVR